MAAKKIGISFNDAALVERIKARAHDDRRTFSGEVEFLCSVGLEAEGPVYESPKPPRKAKRHGVKS